MYTLPHGIKKDPVRRWNLPDRIFFGYGACHILAGVFLQHHPHSGFHAVWLQPDADLPGNHIFVTDGEVAFDFHGYSCAEHLVRHHTAGWSRTHPGWTVRAVAVDFPLLDTPSLNARKMRGPDQYLHDPVPRALRFVERHGQPRSMGAPAQR